MGSDSLRFFVTGIFLSTMFSRLIHVVTPIRTSSHFVADTIPLCVWFLTQKNILVDYGLRRITFLIAQEVSRGSAHRLRLLPSLRPRAFPWRLRADCGGRDGALGRTAFQMMRPRGRWGPPSEQAHACGHSPAGCNGLLCGFLFCRKNFPSFSPSEQEMRYAQTQRYVLSPWHLWFSGRLSQSLRYPQVLP